MKTAVIAAILTVMPMAGFAMGCANGAHKPVTADVCGPGTAWDEEKSACTPVVSS